MKIRIFALAKELGMDSKELIDLCATAGIQLKNSALASISPEERDVVLGLLKKGSGAKKPSDASPMAPTRDDVPDVAKKLREIAKMPSRPVPSSRLSPRAEAMEPVGDEGPESSLEAAEYEPRGEELADTQPAEEAGAPMMPLAGEAPGAEAVPVESRPQKSSAGKAAARETPSAERPAAEGPAANEAESAEATAPEAAPAKKKSKTKEPTSEPAASQPGSEPPTAEPAAPSAPVEPLKSEPSVSPAAGAPTKTRTSRTMVIDKTTGALKTPPRVAGATPPPTPAASSQTGGSRPLVAPIPSKPVVAGGPPPVVAQQPVAPLPPGGAPPQAAPPQAAPPQAAPPQAAPHGGAVAAAAAKMTARGTVPGSSDRGPAGPVGSTPPTPTGPMTRSEYIGASGSAQRRPMRYDMAPRGSVSPTDAGSERGKKDRVLPSLAMPPKMESPVKKPVKPHEEGPAQKPTVRLTPGMISSSPLIKHVQERDARKGGPLGVNRIGRSGKTIEEELLELVEKERKAKGLTDRKKPSDSGRRRSGKLGEDDDRPSKMRMPRVKRKGQVAYKSAAEIELPITVRSLSEAIGRPAKDLLKVLFQKGQMLKINDGLTEEQAVEIAIELGVDLTVVHERDPEVELAELFEADDAPETLISRPPIVTILGHVDHGKTTLVDKIRSTTVAAGEAGGITQHIAAYQVEHQGRLLTFVDTPGHAAFGEMRARGANVTDIVVLVVSAADGVMQQTIECISHAKSAKVPIVVAINKIDLPTANPQRVMQQLAQHDVLVTEWGGEIEVVKTSGQTGEGLDILLETLLLTADINELKANPDRPAVGVCLESFRDEGRGSLAWLVVQKGTLQLGDMMLCGSSYGKIRAIYDDNDNLLIEAPPSTPVKVAGLDQVPGAGDRFFVMEDLEEARQIAESRRQKGRFDALAGRKQRPRTLDEILEAARGGAVQDLPLILKVDTPGSLEALRHEIGKIDHPEVRVQVIHEGIGGVNESDVALAHAGGAIIIAFHVIPEDRAESAAEREGVEIRRYDIIYEVTDHIKRRLEGLLIPEKRQVNTGRAIVLRTFSISRIGTVAGCRVLGGTIERSNKIQVIRDQKILNEYPIASLKREKDDVKEVRDGFECGIRLDGFNDVKEGDLLQAYKVEEVKRTLE